MAARDAHIQARLDGLAGHIEALAATLVADVRRAAASGPVTLGAVADLTHARAQLAQLVGAFRSEAQVTQATARAAVEARS